jgi:hypothetical protein
MNSALKACDSAATIATCFGIESFAGRRKARHLKLEGPDKAAPGTGVREIVWTAPRRTDTLN